MGESSSSSNPCKVAVRPSPVFLVSLEEKDARDDRRFHYFLTPSINPGGQALVQRIRITSNTEVLSLPGFSL